MSGPSIPQDRGFINNGCKKVATSSEEMMPIVFPQAPQLSCCPSMLPHRISGDPIFLHSINGSPKNSTLQDRPTTLLPACRGPVHAFADRGAGAHTSLPLFSRFL